MKINEDLFEKGLTVGVALSGGRDSSALFHYLRNRELDLGVKIVAINVEHGIREKSKLESRYIEDFCKKENVPCLIFSVDVPKHAKENKLTIEQSARILRYECFDKAIKSSFCDVIATAHHADDDAETILMRIFRGTGTRGLGGIIQKRGNIIRPMLEVTREEIDSYLKENDIFFFDDESNEDVKYTRNFLRKQVIPLIRQKYPSLTDSLIRLGEISALDEAHFDRLAQDKLDFSEIGAVKIKIKDLKDEALAFRLIIKAFNHLGVNSDVEYRHVKLLLDFISAQNGKVLDMPYFIRAYREYDEIVFEKAEEASQSEIVIDKFPFECEFLGQKISFELKDERENGLCVDGDKLLGAVIRQREKGDRFKRFKGGEKSLGDYFTDLKYPLRKRDKTPVIARDKNVLAIVGVEISDSVKITEGTKRIVKINGGKNVFGRI